MRYKNRDLIVTKKNTHPNYARKNDKIQLQHQSKQYFEDNSHLSRFEVNENETDNQFFHNFAVQSVDYNKPRMKSNRSPNKNSGAINMLQLE